MSTVIHSINYQFNPDKNAQSLCESIVKDIDGNGVKLSDISVVNASTKEATVTTQFNWSIKVSLKASIMSGKETKNAVIHNSVIEAQAAAKKQGQYIIQNSLGKIELIQNINEDPEHFFKHSSVKLNGGKQHACIETCERHCDRGQITCPRCQGKGTHKAITKKQDLLGTTENFSAINTCPDCKGKGTINCANCSGSGEVKRLYTVHVDATRKHNNSVTITDTAIKANIENFLSRQSHNTLFEEYLSPVITELKDIDKDHCSVIYQSKTKYTLLTLSVLNKDYKALGFGDNSLCISKPKILDDILPPAINAIISFSPKIHSTSKYLKIQSMPLINLLISSDKNRSPNEMESFLNKNANGLLSKEAAQSIVEKITLLKNSLMPRFSLFSWITVISGGIFSSYYFGLKPVAPLTTLMILAVHITAVVTLGYMISKNITRWKRKKLNLKLDAPTLERIPSLLASALIVLSTLSPNLMSVDSRWSSFFTAEQIISIFAVNNTLQNETISSQKLIMSTQRNLKLLGYKDIVINGDYDKETDYAVKDLQQRFRLNESKYLNRETMNLINKYARLKENNFSLIKNK